MWSLSDLAYYIGITIVFATHLYIIWSGGMPMSQSIAHSYLNLAAAFMIAYSFVSDKGYLKGMTMS